MSFLIALLLPVIATTLLFRAYPGRAARRLVPRELTTPAAVRSGALAGAAALVFLGLVGVAVLVSRGKPLTPGDTPALAFWLVQFGLAAAIGAAVGVLTALSLLPWVRERLERVPPAPPAP